MKQYENPPLVEAVCQVRFDRALWNPTLPGLVYKRLEENFPIREQGDQSLNVHVDVGSGRSRLDFSQEVIFRSEDESNVVILTPRQVSVHQLEPYPGWETFRPQILEVVRATAEELGTDSSPHVVLRYINQFEWPERIDVSRMFSFGLRLEGELSKLPDAFIAGAQFSKQDEDSLRIELTTTPVEEPNEFGVTFDLQYRAEREIELDGFEEWLERAHTRIEEHFEGAVKAPLRESFHAD